MTLEEELKKEDQELEIEKITTQNKISVAERDINLFKRFAKLLIYGGGFVMISGIVPFFLIDVAQQKLNLYGDFIGGSVASLWSLAGLLYIYIAFLAQKQQGHMQRLELKYGQYEMKSTRLELFEQRNQMRLQNTTLAIQRFESTFFLLLQSQNEILKLIDYRDRDNKIISTGRDCFRSFYTQFQNKTASIETLNDVLEQYVEVFEEHDADLGHYFRNLYHILRFVHESDIDDKYKYTRLVRAQLSAFELAFLFYNCLSENGIHKFKPLVERYTMLKNMNWKLVISDDHLLEYAVDAYGKKIDNFHQIVTLRFFIKGAECEYIISMSDDSIGVRGEKYSTVIQVTSNNFIKSLKEQIQKILDDYLVKVKLNFSLDSNVVTSIVERIFRLIVILDKRLIIVPFDSNSRTHVEVEPFLKNIFLNSYSS